MSFTGDTGGDSIAATIARSGDRRPPKYCRRQHRGALVRRVQCAPYYYYHYHPYLYGRVHLPDGAAAVLVRTGGQAHAGRANQPGPLEALRVSVRGAPAALTQLLLYLYACGLR